MGQRGGECVGCGVGDIKEFENLSMYLFNLKHGTVADSEFPKVSPDNKITSVMAYLKGCPFPVIMQRINKHFSPNVKDRNIYKMVPPVKYAVLSKAVEVVYDSGINRYQITDHGREIAELLMAVRVGVSPFTSSQSAPYQVYEARSPAPSSPRQRAQA